MREIRFASLGLSLGLVATMSLLGACGSGSTGTSASGKTYEFGILIPETGPSSDIGDVERNAVELAVTKVNGSGLLGSAKLKPIFADHQGQATVAVSAFNQMQALHHPAVVLSTQSSPTLALVPIADRAHVVLFNIGAVAPELTGASSWLFDLDPLVNQQVAPVVDYAVKNRNITKVGVIYENNATGVAMKKELPGAAQASGISYVGAESYEMNDTNFKAQLAKLKGLGADSVYIAGDGTSQFGEMIQQAHGMGYDPVWLSDVSFANPVTLQVAGSAAEGAISALGSQVDAQTLKPNAMADAFNAAYQKRYGKAPTTQAADAYDSILVLGQAIADATKGGAKLTSDDLRDAFDKVKVDTVDGQIQFQKDGTVSMPIEIQVVKNGAFVPVAVVPPLPTGN